MCRAKPFVFLALVVSAVLFSGCAFDQYKIGEQVGKIPSADTNVNLLILGGFRGGDKDSRHGVWCPLFCYDSFNDGTSFKILGPPLPNCFGYLNMKKEQGFVTPIFSHHTGALESICFGPLFFPIIRYDYAADGYKEFSILGPFLSFGRGTGGINVLGLGSSENGSEVRPIFTKFYYKRTDATQVSIWESWAL